MDPYQLLNLTPLATREEVETRYKELCEKYPIATHPDERSLIDEAYLNIIREMEQTKNAKIAHVVIPEQDVDTPSEDSSQTVEKDELQEKRNKSGRSKLIMLIGGGLIAGVILSTAAFTYLEKNDQTTVVEEPGKTESTTASIEASSESEEVVDEGPTEEELAAEEKERQEEEERKKQEDLEQEKEAAVEVVNDVGNDFFQDLQSALIEQSARQMSSTTSKFRNAFQPSLNSLKEHDSIFDGEIDMRSVTSDSIKSVTSQKIIVQTTTDYSSRSYNPYLQEEPQGNAIIWDLTLVKQGDEWLVDERKLIKDEASTEEMPIREQVKYDLASTLNIHAMEWLEAYQQKDTSFFTKVDSPDYISRQEKYYATLDKNDRYYEGEFLGLDYSFDSVDVLQGKNITATIEAKAMYHGAYYDTDTDEMVDEDDTEASVFRYTLWYRNQEWVIINTKEINGFSAGDVRTFNENDEYYDDY